MIALLPHCGFLSETTRMLQLAQALRARGVPVVLASHGGPFAGVLDAAGWPWTRLAPAMGAARCRQFVADVLQLGRPGLDLLTPEEVRASVQAEAAFLRACGAQAVVTGFTLTALLSSRLAGVPLVTSHGGSMVPPLYERGLAPVPTTMPLPGAEWLPGWLKRWIVNTSPARMRAPVRFLNTVAAELGVEPVPSLAALMLGDLTLVTELPEVLGISAADVMAWRPRGRAYRPSTRLVATGPLFAHLELPVPAQALALLARRDPPTVLVVPTSTPTALLRAMVAQTRAAGAQVIVGAGLHDFGPVDDPGVVVCGLLPNHVLMPQVDAVVIAGGQGSVQTAMASGVPWVGVPLQPEQELNLGLAMRQGVALAVAPRHAGSAALAAAVRRVLNEPGFRQRAQRVRGWYAGVDGAGQAATALLHHLGHAGPGAAP
jgi:UDP:flavonoid glycosyltransferase YjiC (YdhE family)